MKTLIQNTHPHRSGNSATNTARTRPGLSRPALPRAGVGYSAPTPRMDAATQAHRTAPQKEGHPVILFRQELGDVLRSARRSQGRTLRQVSSDARVSLGYLSEIERGQKEASSELLASVTEALGMPLSFVLREVSDRIAVAEGVSIPDTVPDDLAEDSSALVCAH